MSTYVQPSSVLSNIPDNACCKNLTISNSDFNNQDLVFWKDNGYNGGAVLAWQSIKSTVPPFVANEEFILPSISKNTDTGIVQATLLTNSPLQNGSQYLTVGPSTGVFNYNTIQAAINYAHTTLLATSINQVVINIYPGTYAENLVLYDGIILNAICLPPVFAANIPTVTITGTVSITQTSTSSTMSITINNINFTNSVASSYMLSCSFNVAGVGSNVVLSLNYCKFLSTLSYLAGIVNNNVGSTNGSFSIRTIGCTFGVKTSLFVNNDSTCSLHSLAFVSIISTYSITYDSNCVLSYGAYSFFFRNCSSSGFQFTVNGSSTLSIQSYSGTENNISGGNWINGNSSGLITVVYENMSINSLPTALATKLYDFSSLTNTGNSVKINCNSSVTTLPLFSILNNNSSQIFDIKIESNVFNSSLKYLLRSSVIKMEIIQSGIVTTADATATVLASFTTPDNCSVFASAEVCGNKLDYTDTTSGTALAGFVNAAGTLTQADSSIYNIFNTTTGTFTLSATTNVVNLKVEGIAATNYEWSGNLKVIITY